MSAETDMCHNGHLFEPGIDIDMAAEGRSPDPRWCNVCGDTRGWLVGPSADRKRRVGSVQEQASTGGGQRVPLEGGEGK